MNQYALDLIKQFEGCRLKAYKDGGGVPTIGWGETRNVKMGDVITQQQADDMLSSRLQEFETDILKLVKVPLSAQQMGALICFTYNVGVEALKTSTLLKKVNNLDPTAADEFLKWCNVNGKPVNGLLRRREAERSLYISVK